MLLRLKSESVTVPGGVGIAGNTAMGRVPNTEWWSVCVEGLPRWLWAATLLWVSALAVWGCWVQAQTGPGTDGEPAGRGMSPRERLWFLLLLVPPTTVCLAAWLRTHLLGG